MRNRAAHWLLVALLIAFSRPSAALDNACASCASPPAFTAAAVYTGEVWRQVSGGLGTGERYLDDLDVSATLDGAAYFGIEALTLFARVLYNNGRGLNDELAGSAQGVSNIETVRALRLYELWGEWSFGSQLSLRTGLYDLNSEFDSIAAAGLFINPSQGIGPDLSQSGLNGPSIFPNTGLAVRARYTFGPWSIQAAALDAVPGDPNHPRRTRIQLSSDEGALAIAEVTREAAGVRISAGYWRYTETFADLESAAKRDDNAGMYLSIASPKLLTGSAGRTLELYVRGGQAQSNINPIGEYLGAGAVYSGLLTADDQLGLSMGVAQLGAPFRRAQATRAIATTRREYAWELTYRFNLTQWLAVQPDVQYIRHPGMDPELDGSWLLGLRFEVSHAW